MAGTKEEEASILAAVDKLDAPLLRTRTEGLEALRRIFGQDRPLYRVDEISDNSFHTIFEAIFRVIRAERPKYIRATTSASQNASTSRLNNAAKALRVLVEAIGSRLKQKTANAVLDHVIDTLPDVDGGFFSPIQTDYVNIFSLLLSSVPRGEHLRPKQWQAYVDFIVDTISEGLENEAENTEASLLQRQSSTNSRTGISVSVRLSQTSSGRAQQLPTKISQDGLLPLWEEMLRALKYLSSITNAPMVTRFDSILRLVLRWLETVFRSEELIFDILNLVLPTVLSEDITLAATTFNSISRLVRQRDLWSKTKKSQSHALQENILATLTLCRSLFVNTTWSSPLVPISTLEQLTEIMRSGYENDKTPNPDRLQVEDLGFSSPTNQQVMSLGGVYLMSESSGAVVAWSTVSTIACLLIGIAKKRQDMEHSNSEETALKRRKIDDPIGSLFHQATSYSSQGRLVALQIALFVVDIEKVMTITTIDQLLQTTLPDLEDEPAIASWTCLLLSRIISLKHAHLAPYPDFCRKIWSWASRASASAAITRPACYLLYTMIQSSTFRPLLSSQLVCESLFPDGVSGPSVVTDAALMLLHEVLVSDLIDTEKAFKYLVSSALRWLDSQWTISSVPDRSHNAQIASLVRSDNLYTLLMAMVGNRTYLVQSVIPSLSSSVCKALWVEAEDLVFTQYMLSSSHALRDKSRLPEHSHSSYVPPTGVLNQLRQAVFDMLTSKIKSFYTACKLLAEELHSVINLPVLETAATACLLCYTVAKDIGPEQSWSALQLTTKSMWDLIIECLGSQTKDAVVKTFPKLAARLTNIQLHNSQAQDKLSASRAELIAGLDEVFQQYLESQDGIAVLDPEFMSSHASRASQDTQSKKSQTDEYAVRTDLAVSNDSSTFLVRQSFLLKLDLARSRAFDEPRTSWGTAVVDTIVALEPEELLVTKDIVVQLLDSEIVIARADSSRLLTRLAEVFLQRTELARCEAALCLCLRASTRLVPMWATDQDDDLANVGYDIYQWCINIALGKGIASQRVLLCIASLLDSVLRCNQSYGTDTLPSARTSLLQILSSGLIGLKFRLVGHLSNLFGGYILSEHPAVFDDIIDNLPSDPDKQEGIVLRLYVIAKLGAQWHTILRQSIYHIFETAANVPKTIMIAAKCVQMVCNELELESTQVLLQLFSPQVLYTWLEKQDTETIPFRAFGYDTLAALQSDIQDELVSQIAMRSSTVSVQNIVRVLGASWDSLIERWFAKVVAYAIITDIAIARSSREIGKAEMALVQQLGEDSYAKLCRHNIAEAISIILLRLSDDRGFEKILGDDDEIPKFVATYESICSRSSSQMQLPPGQQPSYRAKHLIQILDRMCMRGQETLESIWSPALLVHVYRGLLADAKPAFGPLHTCAILRKVRVVICLAGPTALSGYPLQMLLHTLRPFLTQFHSSEDACGIFWYLLEHGKAYLKQKLPFVTGLSVSIFASLSRFASSSQESTTQESHFVSTMSKAQEFRNWLGGYLENFSVAETGEDTASMFTCMVQAAKQVTRTGSSAKTTAEGSLLYYLLDDQASAQPLLPDAFFRLTLRTLCHDFAAAADFQDDILYDDEDVLRFTAVLWSILNHQNLQDPFRIWVSQALGRAYSLQGPSITDLNNDGRSSNAFPGRADLVIEDSYQNIVSQLFELLWDEDRTSACASEATLQSIFSALPRDSKSTVLGTATDHSMFDELRFVDMPCPALHENVSPNLVDKLPTRYHDGTSWASEIVSKICQHHQSDFVLSFLPPLIALVPSVAEDTFPYVVHLALYFETDKDSKTRDLLTETFEQAFDSNQSLSKGRIQLALNCITHLRRCILPSETSMAKRNSWLPIDFGAAAAAALRCELYRMALLMLEIHVSQYRLTASRSSRRSSHGDLSIVPDILNQIYQNVDDPDFFYGTHEESDIASIVEKLCHEGRGYKALSFQSALFDSNIRTEGVNFALNANGGKTVSALNLANLNGLSSAIGNVVADEYGNDVLEQNLQSLLNLHQWDVARDRALPGHGIAMLTALKSFASAAHRENVLAATDQSTLDLAQLLVSNIHQRAQRINYWTSLAVVAELKEILSVSDTGDLESLFLKRSARRAWTEQESFDCVEPILLGREAIFSTIKSSSQLRSMMNVTAPQAILLEIKSLRTSLSLGHVHEISQFCLNRAAYLSALLPSATALGVNVEAAIQYDLANTFWAQQETGASIRRLQNLYERELPDQAIEVQQAEILTDLGSKIAEARLDRPDEVTAKYLVPAIKALGNDTMGSKVGRVFHNFAAFCDSQLRDPDNVDEYERVEKIRDRKLQEVLELENMYKKGDAKIRDTVKAHFAKAKTWFKLDNDELQRLKAHRDRLVRNCLENYLKSLRACQDFPNDVLRFLALWMEQSANPLANASVGKYLSTVPTYKFAPLMNQLSSRILNEDSTFQQLLSVLMYHICEDHPFHSLYQIFATSKSKGAQRDEVANSRHAAATKLSEKVMKKSSASNLWISIHNSNIQFVRVAQEKFSDKELKTGSKLLLRKLPQGAKLEQTMQDMHHKIPPPTMKVGIKPTKDYTSVPTIAKFDPQISIAGGVSAPKIITVIANDGSRHKMLLKGGNDDLRQDSIMEQVFEQVSDLLQDHRATRQRKLGIRTYKVIPLTHNAGIIEFVRDTMPLHDYVLPAHTRYYPKDYKPNKCRKEIADAQSKSLPQRLQAYRNVVTNFHPVMRFFFMEHFLDPDEWFQKRLNYSRSTAAISMLGHVLGLGDRHGHNILLDTKTGEVVHIDLGVAFEAGRVLPVPEVVPFRLTRDLVDGMGLSGVEGVFRRCCNFTLEALRGNQEAIMTILDVLRWDPLYSWSVSPLRLARMQENQEQAANAAEPTSSGVSESSASVSAGDRDAVAKRNNVNEPSEADRALAVVSKKLGKSLSVEATVNELIRQATDEHNLAVLYCGWAAYA